MSTKGVAFHTNPCAQRKSGKKYSPTKDPAGNLAEMSRRLTQFLKESNGERKRRTATVGRPPRPEPSDFPTMNGKPMRVKAL